MARARHLRLHLILAAALLAAACGSGCDFSIGIVREPLLLATTTSVGNSGLLDRLLPGYESDDVRPVLVGSGRALEMLASGTASVIITHAPAREAQALAVHPAWHYRKILFNDFLIVGPAEDPAGVATASTAADAMRRIASSSSMFLSRGDESGTHERELELWTRAGARPEPSRLVIAGAGMGQTLRIANSTGGYTLTDRGTFLALRESIALVPLHEGDPVLLNTYAVIASSEDARAMRFVRWMTEGEGRRLLRELTAGPVQGFDVWPEGGLSNSPSALPR